MKITSLVYHKTTVVVLASTSIHRKYLKVLGTEDKSSDQSSPFQKASTLLEDVRLKAERKGRPLCF